MSVEILDPRSPELEERLVAAAERFGLDGAAPVAAPGREVTVEVVRASV